MNLDSKLTNADMDVLNECITSWADGPTVDLKLIEVLKSLKKEDAPEPILEIWDHFEEVRSEFVGKEKFLTKEKQHRQRLGLLLKTKLLLIHDEQIAGTVISDSVDENESE